MENAEKPYGLSFESADVYAESLGIQIKNYELVAIMLCPASADISSPENIKRRQQEIMNLNNKVIHGAVENPTNLSHHILLINELVKIARSNGVDYICSIKIFGVNNLALKPETIEKAFWMNTLTATGLRQKKKPETKTEPPPMLTINKPVEA